MKTSKHAPKTTREKAVYRFGYLKGYTTARNLKIAGKKLGKAKPAAKATKRKKKG